MAAPLKMSSKDKIMITKAQLAKLTHDGAVLYGLAAPLVVSRAGVTSKGRIWLQIGEKPVLLPALKDWTEDGCGIAATGSSKERLYIVAPEDVDDMRYGQLLDDISEGRALMKEADCLRLLGDEA
ncbi:MAG TPA: hypothetical protein DDZ88_04715 [Verrucomicrobiales bacterium]|nr:hypothetical protein [Verrucomicrobiales bacterium]